MHLINKNRASFIVPVISALSIAVLAIIGYIFFNETLTTFEIIGVIIIVVGIIIMNIQKNKIKDKIKI